ncbi:hypothetical protein [Solilutibacter silvestris]|uniref:hypothetical protein n=1 Tax=Solilutibacter silvestris TaxID=1645665 RepID=UPI003D33183E
MSDFSKLIDSLNRHIGTYHPVTARDETKWFPGNEAASLLLQSQHIWEDLLILASIHRNTTDNYAKKLILKYVFMETKSLIEVFDKLCAIVAKTSIFDPYERHGHREITAQEKEQAFYLNKEFYRARNKTEKAITEIRDNISAHRGNLKWHEVQKFWDQVSPETLQPIFDAFPPAFDHLKDLDLYEWNRRTEDGCMEFITTQWRPEYKLG